MNAFDRAADKLFRIPAAPALKYGISEAVARANFYTSDLDDLSEITARRLVKDQWWDTMRLDQIAQLSEPVGYELFVTGYSCGIAAAGQALQYALNGFNRSRQDYLPLVVDGVVGPLTVHALRLFLVRRSEAGERGMAAMLMEKRLALMQSPRR